MIHEEICTYEVCKLAKEKGFNVPTRTVKVEKIKGTEKEVWDEEECRYITQWETRSLRIPTQSLLQRWLREEKNIVVVVDWFSIERKYYWSVFDTTKADIFASFIPPARSASRYDTWEQALERGLEYALKELE